MVKSSWFDTRAGFTSPVTGTPGVPVRSPAVGLSVAVPRSPSLVPVTSAVTGGTLSLGTVVLVSSPPQAVRIMATTISIDKSKLVFLIPSYSFQRIKKLVGCLNQKNHTDGASVVTNSLLYLIVETCRSDQCDTFEMSLRLFG